MSVSFPSRTRATRLAANVSALCTVAILLSGCVVEETHRRPVRRVTVVETAPPPPTPAYVEAPAPAVSGTISIQVAPPPLRREVVVVRPSPRHVWVPGYWGWRGGRHVWIDGRWMLPPRGRAVWVAPRWEHRHGNYVFIEGFWR